MKRIVLSLALAAACSGKSEPVRQPAPAPVATAPAVQAPVRSIDEPSIYELGLVLVDSRGERVGLDVARGKPVLVTMFYASCTVACPALVQELKRTLAELPRDDVHVLLVSFDAARDTPEKLAELARVHGLDARWTLASAVDADARELAATIGYKYRKVDNGEFFHGATIVALDETGAPIARTEGFNKRAPLLAALR